MYLPANILKTLIFKYHIIYIFLILSTITNNGKHFLTKRFLFDLFKLQLYRRKKKYHKQYILIFK